MERDKCMLQAWVYEDGVGWRENLAGSCSGLNKNAIAKMLNTGRCGTTLCPFFKPASLGRPDEIIRDELPNGRVTFTRRRSDVLL